jgi:spoIIIJ-associated protein
MTEKKETPEPLLTKEYEGNTAEEAIEIALAELKVPRESIKIQILTEGTRGLFGMQGAKMAKIRVSILPKNKEE